jgi:hypothetical protein
MTKTKVTAKLRYLLSFNIPSGVIGSTFSSSGIGVREEGDGGAS